MRSISFVFALINTKSCNIFLLHLIGAIILEAERRRDGHHDRRAAVAEDVEVAVKEAFVVDDADHDEVQVDALDAHPGERRQEEVVQQPGDDRAEELRRKRGKERNLWHPHGYHTGGAG